jgi:hypothetical protein
MKRFFTLLAALTLCSVCVRAQTLELSFNAGTQPFSVNLALTNLILLENPEVSLEAAASNRRISAGVQSALEFGPLGRATAFARFGVAFVGGVRFEAGVRGSLGPVLLELGGAFWSANVSEFNPSNVFAWNPEPLSNNGFYVGGQGAYRLTRTLLIVTGGRLGSDQSRLYTRLENRAGDWTYGGGLLFAWQSNGLTYGLNGAVRWSPEDRPFGLEAQVFAGVNAVVGFGFGGAGLAFNYAFEELGGFNAYVVYEVWRLDVLPFRSGGNLELNVGPGTAFVGAFGGADLDWNFGWGVRVGYRLNLGSLLNP